MLIGIEASRANRLQKTGVEWYSYRIIQGLKKMPEAGVHSWLLYGNAPLSMGLERMPSNWHERRLDWPPKYLWTQARLSWEMMRRPPEVLFVPAHVLPRIIPKRSVVTIHDIGFHRFPQLYKKIQVAYHEATTQDIIKRAAKIITVSEFSKQEIVEGYGADPSRITVTHLGVDHEKYRPAAPEAVAAVQSRLQIMSPYFMFVGRLEAKKNILTVLEAFKQFKEARGEGDPTRLVLCGPTGAGFEQIENAYHASGLGEAIKLTGYLPEADKIALLTGASALVHPAWYEGFGLTPLEAMACDCPVISSDAASLPEVIGPGNALYFSPDDPATLAALMAQILDAPDQAADLRARGRMHVQSYTWERTARATLKILTEW